MKKRNLFKVFISVIALFAFFGVITTVEAAYATPKSAKLTGKDTYYYSDSGYGSYNTSDFDLQVFDGSNLSGNQLAASAPGICMTPLEASPPVGTKWESGQLLVLDNTQLVKYLYYGLCPSGCTRDMAKETFAGNHNGATISRGQRVIMIHNALSKVNDPANWKHGLNSAAINDTEDFMEAVDRLEYPTGVFAYKVGSGSYQTIAFLYTTQYNLSINKRTTSNASGVSLAGAEYTIYANNSCTVRAAKNANGDYYDKLVTDQNGNTQQVPVVTRKSYWIKETKRPLDASTGQENMNFSLDDTCHLCDLYNNDSCTVTSQDDYSQDKGILYVKKVDENNRALRGAVFTVYKGACGTGEVVSTLTLNNSAATRNTGYILDLDQAYCVRETTVPNNYTAADDQTFTLSSSNSSHSITLTFINEKVVSGSVRVKKIDNTGQPLQGAVFEIREEADCSGSLVTSITSGADGYATAESLDLGHYCLSETSAPAGYKIDTEKHPFEITESTTTVTLEDIENEAVKGRIKITKTIDPDSGVKYDLSKNENYTFAGTVFNIYKGSCGFGVLHTTATIPEGQDYVYVEDLEPGTYCVNEKNAPKGYEISTQEVTRTITGTGTKSVTFEDAPKLGKLKLKKYSSNPKVAQKYPEKYSIAGAQFEVWDEAHENMVGIFTVDANGDANVLEDIPFGKYYAFEVKGPDVNNKEDNLPYEKAKNIIPVEITEETPEATFKATDTLINGHAFVNKVPAEQPDGSCTLAGAEYAICLDEDCRETVEGSPLITGEDGKTQTIEVEPGVYYFQEQKAPECFEVNPEVQKITVASGETVKVTSKEELIPQNPKTGIDNPYLITITTIAIGGAGLYFLRRKNAFRQI